MKDKHIDSYQLKEPFNLLAKEPISTDFEKLLGEKTPTHRSPGAQHASTAAKPAKRLTVRSSDGKTRGFPADATLS